MPVVSPWLQFVLDAVGILLAVGAIAAVVLGGINRRSIPIAVAVAVPAVFLVVLAPQVARSFDHLNQQRKENAGTPASQARDRCLVDGGATSLPPFVEYLRKTLPAKAKYFATSTGGTDAACLTYVLLPRLYVGLDRAQYVVFLGKPPADLLARIVPGTLRRFAPDQAVGRLRG